jgi:hypothetical protein
MENDIIARAYILAAECSDIDQVRFKLKREGYTNVDAHLSSGTLRTELKIRLNSRLS